LAFFSGLSVWITCLGLIGMSAYSATMRRKEIGIRKVLGSTAQQVLLLLWKEYFVTVMIASAIAIPAAWYIARLWLTDFALQIHLSPVLFAVPVILLLVITLLTVAFQTVKAAWANPVESLRNE
jgi:putative ABC transport system permease protein